MPRTPIPPGETGGIAVVPLGYDASDDDQIEVTIPRPSTDDGNRLDYPKGTKAGQSIKVETPVGVREYLVTRWRGLARIVDPEPVRSEDGEVVFVNGKPKFPPPMMIRRWAPTKAAAEEATKRAARSKLDDLRQARQARREAAEAAEQAAFTAANAPDPTTVGALLSRWRIGLHDPSNRLHESTKDDYETVIRSLLGEPLRAIRGGKVRPRSPGRLAMAQAFQQISAMRPADVDARTLKDLLRSVADTNGKGTAIKVRSILAHVWDLAMEDRKLGVQVNVVRALRGTESNPVIPSRTKRVTGLDHKHAPTDDEYRSLIDALASDPEAGPMALGRRNKSAHGQAGKGEPNGKDIRDLVSLLFFTGARQGELLALRWSDVELDGDDPHISIRVTLTYTPGQPLRRTPTKTRGGTRNVYLVPQAVAMLRARAEHFDVSNESDPVFGSPQYPHRIRDASNLNRSIRNIFDRHGVTWGRSHIGRKYVVNHLLRQGVALPEIAKVVGWSDVLTVSKYADGPRRIPAHPRRRGESITTVRILFAAIPAYGHLFPLLPLISACADAGHEVTIATGEPFLDRLAWPTVRGMPAEAKLDALIEQTRRRHPDAHGYHLSVAMFADVTAEVVCAELDRVVIDLRPDLMVYEPMNIGAAMVADVHDVPAVGFSIGLATFVVDLIADAARGFRADFWATHGRVPPPGNGLLAAALIDPAPPSLASADGPPTTARRIPIRSVAFDAAGTVPDWLTGPRTRPAVYLTLGTVSFGAVEVIRRAVDQVAGLDVDVLVAVGPQGDPAALGPVPGNVHVERFVAQPQVLELVDVAVHHGGTGTVLGAAAAGVPQLVLPQGADQFHNAELIATAGIGRSLSNDRQDGGAITAAVTALLADGPERERADELRLEIAAMPAPEQVVPELIVLAENGPPGR